MTDPLVGRLVDGRYEIVSRIARGGMATVYLALDRRLDREVALKVMHPHLADSAQGTDFVSRFRREARAAARLTHPGLVAVYDQGVDEDMSYLTMEYIDGTNLRSRLLVEGALSVQDAFDTLEAILDALAAAHRNNLVHRDIKPENVLLSADGRIKVADFGLARAVTEVTSTTTGTIMGTVAYLGPELILTGACDARTDVYAAGVLLYEMLVGAQPYTGATPIQVAYKHVNEDIPLPSAAQGWLGREIDDLVSALAARDPENRPVDANAALNLLRRTRSAISEEDLARRADVVPVSVPLPPSEQDDTDEHSNASDVDSGSVADSGPDPDSVGTAHVPLDAGARGGSGDPSQDKTQALGIGAAGSTIAFPLGVGSRGESPIEPETEIAAPRRRRRRRRVITTLIVLLTVLAIIAGYATWFFNVGPGAYTNVPSGLIGSSAHASTTALGQFGLESTQEKVFDDTVPAGDVISTVPNEGDRIPKDGTVELLVSKGIEMFQIPKTLVGKTEKKATAALKKAQFAVGESTYVYDNKVKADVVIKVSEKSGAKVPHDTVVTLTVSRGPEPVPVPQVVNSPVDSAKAALESLDLKVKVKKVFSDDVAKGRVISQVPEAKSTAYFGDTVTITVSKGRELVEVPNVTGLDTSAAHQLLEEANLVPKDKLFSGGFFGKVRFQSEDPGTKVPLGTEITLTIF